MKPFLNQFAFIAGSVYELTKGIITFTIIVILIHLFLATINRVSGTSMLPNFTNGEFIIVDKLSYMSRFPRRGEVVTIRFPGDPDHQLYIKRVIGLPGETIRIEDGIVTINGRKLYEPYIASTGRKEDIERTLSGDQFYLMGDNRGSSSDSRIFGPVEHRFIIGRAVFIFWPLGMAGLVPPVYYYSNLSK